MDKRLKHQTLIKNILLTYAGHKPAHGDIESHVTFDDEHGSYMLLDVGWHGKKYVHDIVVHVELIKDKIWIQLDGTEEGIATELVEAGIPKDDIVLGFRHPTIRQYTGFAVA